MQGILMIVLAILEIQHFANYRDALGVGPPNMRAGASATFYAEWGTTIASAPVPTTHPPSRQRRRWAAYASASNDTLYLKHDNNVLFISKFDYYVLTMTNSPINYMP